MTNKGYLYIKIDGQRIAAHRLAFLYQTSEWPPEQIDHEDMVKHHNWWSNLRPATQAQNMLNRAVQSNSKTGLKLIHWHKHSKRYVVQTNVAGAKRHFGYYKKLEAAIDVAAQVMLTFHSDFARAA